MFLRILGAGDARHHTQPLHHGVHSEAAARAVRVAPDGALDARLDGRTGTWGSGSTSPSGTWRHISGRRPGPLVLIAVFWTFRLTGAAGGRARRHAAGQSDRQHSPLRRPAAHAARLADRLRPLLLLGHLLRLCADPPGCDRRGEARRRARRLARQRAARLRDRLGKARQPFRSAPHHRARLPRSFSFGVPRRPGGRSASLACGDPPARRHEFRRGARRGRVDAVPAVRCMPTSARR